MTNNHAQKVAGSVFGLIALYASSGAAHGRESFVQISAGGFHTCALTAASTVRCWGANFQGQVGDGTKTDRLAPVSILTLPGTIKAVSAGGKSTCAVMEDGFVWCWGSNEFGQLGNGSTTDSAEPRLVRSLRDAVTIDAGAAHACAITADTRVVCWGLLYTEPKCTYDFLRGTTCTYTHHRQTEPMEVSGLRGSRSISTSGSRGFVLPDYGPSVCGVDAAGAVRCAARFDQEASLFPGLERDVVSLAVGFESPCATTSTGTLKCASFQFGRVVAAAPVTGMERDVVSISSRWNVTCATTTSGRAMCWGRGGDLGDGTSITRRAPIEITALGDVASVSTGMEHACALLTNGEAYCWGDNRGGKLGNASPLLAHVSPVGVAGYSERVLPDSPGPLTGLWWNPAESGWGFQIADRRETSVVALYVYDAAGKPKWYFASNCVFGANALETEARCSSPLHEYRESTQPPREAGRLTLEFTGRNAGNATITIDGVTRATKIERYVFRAGANPLSINYSDLWWNPQEPGRGMGVAHQADRMFLTWYVYEAGEPVWYHVADCVIGSSGCSGTLYRATGPAYAASFNPSQVQSVAVGSASLVFIDPNQGTLSYSIQGVSGTRPITRYRF